MAKKNIDWMKKNLDAALPQFDQFTTKLPGYASLFGLTLAQTTASRNDYLWANYSNLCTAQYEQELKNRFGWKDSLLNGRISPAAAQVPGLGGEFPPPAAAPVPDGILRRWRQLVDYLKKHPAYTKAIGIDLGIEAPAAPAQATKARIRNTKQDGGKVIINVLKDGHDALALFCKRGQEEQPSLVGIFTRARIEDVRPPLVPGTPEQREYTVQYRDNDQPVGETSDVCILTKQP
jgi:hypothetical protein